MANNQRKVKLSIVLVTWNSVRHLDECLASLEKQTFKDFEIVIIDNGSTDGGLDGEKQKWPDLQLRIKRLPKNRGFSVANNFGARLARGRWLALLNTDAFPEPDWLESLLRAAEQNPEYSFFSSRQIQANNPERLDGAGDACHISGLAWRWYYDYPVREYGLEPCEVFSACAAAALYDREAFLQVGGFDEDFFSYHEDVDLSFRLRLQGFRCLYVPDAVVRHVGSASVGAQSDFALYHWQRNFIWSFVQNMPGRLLWLAIPHHIFANIFYQLNYTLRGRGKILWKAKLDALRGIKHALQKRKQIQAKNTVKPLRLLKNMERGILQPYLIGYKIRKIKRKANLTN